MKDVAFLVWPTADKQTRRASKSWDWNSNTGAKLLIDVLGRSGIEVGTCSAETAHLHKVVLLSLASTFDVHNVIRAVGRLRTWRRPRDFVAIAGGFGMQNVIPLRDLIDYAAFGRAEGLIVPLVRAALDRADFDHPSVIPLEGGVRQVTVAQAPELYPHEVPTQPKPFREREVGCPRRCLFCHYTFARQHRRAHEAAFTGAMPWDDREVLFDRLLVDTNLVQRTRTAIDGYSERLRLAFGKPITDDLIRETLDRASAEWKHRIAWFQVYMIGSFPTETDEDRDSFRRVLETVRPTTAAVYLRIHTTPFRPSPWTPAEYLPASLEPDWSKRRLDVIVERSRLAVKNTLFLESPWSHLQSLVVERATADSDELIRTMVFSSKLRSRSTAARVTALANFFDLEPYLREYHTTERLPTGYVTTHVPRARIVDLAKKLKRSLGIEEAAP